MSKHKKNRHRPEHTRHLCAFVFPSGVMFQRRLSQSEAEMMCRGIPRAVFRLDQRNDQETQRAWARAAYFMQKLKVSTSMLTDKYSWDRLSLMAANAGIEEPDLAKLAPGYGKQEFARSKAKDQELSTGFSRAIRQDS